MSEAKKIIVVDDDPNLGLLVSALFKNFNYEIITFFTGAELTDYLSSNKPDLILLDLKLPDANGFELCRKLRETPYISDIPIIIISGVSEVDSRVNLIETGADDYISKPFDVRELRARVNRILKRKKIDTSLNPLTALPGSPAIEEFIRKKTAENSPYGFAYIDADNFKAYNDVYGYSKGDEVIKEISKILIESAKKYSPEDYLVGHIGGDDFVLICKPEKIEDAVKEALKNFDSKIREFYSKEDIKTGFIKTLDRQNNLKTFPIMTLSAALVIPTKPVHYAKIVENAFEIKRYLKSFKDKKESYYHKDRRINE
ncbi:MAG: response regulator [Elusimicrobia bacterium]|nr:response regulator [Elusimicrobiota bacterium]